MRRLLFSMFTIAMLSFQQDASASISTLGLVNRFVEADDKLFSKAISIGLSTGSFNESLNDSFVSSRSAGASQNTFINLDGFNGSGDARTFDTADLSGLSQINAMSYFKVPFEIASPHFYTLTGMFEAINVGAYADVSLVGPGIAFSESSGYFDASGILTPGSYTFLIKATSDGTLQLGSSEPEGFAFFEFQFGLTEIAAAVPEPATFLVWSLLGLSTITFRRQRRS